MKYSFVIPCYNSEKTVGSVVEEIQNTMKSISDSYEIILVNDFSKDHTKEVIFGLAENKKNIKAISFAKNFGQHSALLAGYRYTKGEYVISLDDDGQTPADQVDRLINKLEEGYDVVFAKYNNKHHSAFRNFGSRVNDYMACKLIGKPKELYLSSYFIAKRYVIEEMMKYRNSFPYISGLVLRTTGSIANVNVDHRSRMIGQSGYTFGKLLKLWLNGFTAFSVTPLRVGSFAGVILAILGFAVCIYALINKLINPVAAIGWTSMIGVVTIIGGAILLMLGLIGEYLGRVYISMNDSPQYVIRETRGAEDEKE